MLWSLRKRFGERALPSVAITLFFLYMSSFRSVPAQVANERVAAAERREAAAQAERDALAKRLRESMRRTVETQRQLHVMERRSLRAREAEVRLLLRLPSCAVEKRGVCRPN